MNSNNSNITNSPIKQLKQNRKVSLEMSNITKQPMKDKDSTLFELVDKNVAKKTAKDARVLYINNSNRNKMKFKYNNNYVKTSKYTCYDFFPKSLLLQFKRTANIYFLLIMCLQCIPIISPLNSSTAIFPLVVVLSISMIRELLEDLVRHDQDDKENKVKVSRYNNERGKFESDFAQSLEVGDVILINDKEIIPADCVLLSCSNLNKVAFIETANLDGENDLKPKSCLPTIFKFFKESNETLRIKGKIQCNKPISDLYRFNGKIELNKANSYSLNIKQFIYKGTTLKNTKWAMGVVVFTGKESKIVMNSQKGSPKQSHLESTVNKLILVIFSFQVFLCFILASISSGWFSENISTASYLSLDQGEVTSASVTGFLSFFTFLLLLNTMIPISLIVTLEIVKYSQAYFMNKDCDMYSFVKQQFVNCNSCSLNEELGQIKYIFSDKTGTLTANKLEFKAAGIGDELFGLSLDDLKMKDGLSLPFKDEELKNFTIKGKIGRIYEVNLLSRNGKSLLRLDSDRDLIMHYFYCLSLNQTLMVEKTIKKGRIETKHKLRRPTKSRASNFQKSHETPERLQTKESVQLANHFDDYEITYKGPNPDEIILVNFARSMGYTFIGGDETLAKLKVLRDINGNSTGYEDQSFEIMKVMEFNSTRGMMSVVVRQQNCPDPKIVLYSKGGDKKIEALLTTCQPFMLTVKDKANKLAESGLRVLWIAMKVIDPSEFTDWNIDYEDGLKNLVQEDEIQNYRTEKYKLLESGLTLIGCTAVEDKLQDKVPQTIKELQTAGINVWVLTGDNLPTAKIIALRCNLLPPEMEVYELNDDLDKFQLKVSAIAGRPAEDIFTRAALSAAEDLIANFEKRLGVDHEKTPYEEKKSYLFVGLSEMLVKYLQSEEKDKGVLRGILVESDILRNVLPDDNAKELKYYGHPLTKLFLELTLNSQAVVCCRVAPKQKALVVRMAKMNIKGAITLAVGDGANDVSMILEADVGVGIFGEEGKQAAISSDYAVGEFKCLRKLILGHGRLNYIRIAEMILYFFFKNFLFTIPQFYFAFYNGFSGQTIYDDWYVSLYNMIFTAMPLVFKALFEQDFTEEDGEFIKENIPYTYYIGREGLIFNLKQFLINISTAIVESILVFFFTEYMLHYNIPQNAKGYDADIWSISLTQFTAIIFIVNFRLMASQRYHTLLNVLATGLLSYGVYFAYFFVSSGLSFSKSEATRESLTSFPQFYLVIFLVCSMTLLFDLATNFFVLNFVDEPTNLLKRNLSETKETTSDVYAMNDKIRNRILDYDEKVRNLYKVERVDIPKQI